MKKRIKVALVQAEPGLVTEKNDNLNYHVQKIIELKEEKPDLILFPELSVSGYIQESTPENRRTYWELGSEEVPGPSANRIIEAAHKVGSYVIFGIAERTSVPMLMYNSAVLVGPDGFIGVARKIHLPLLEKDYFITGTEPKVFNTRIGKIGIIICYELFFPEPTRILAIKGAEICAFIGFVAVRKNGKGGGVGIGEEKQLLFNMAPVINAIENQVHFLVCTAGGLHDMGPNMGKWQRAGHSKIIDNLGTIVAESKTTSEDLIIAELSNKRLLEGRIAYPMLKDRMPRMYRSLIKTGF